MKHRFPLLVFIILVGSSIISSFISYQMRENYIERDVQNALAMTLAERDMGVVDADTIRTYRSHITVDEVKDTACISVRTANDGSGTVLEANAGCGFLTVFVSSNQRASGVLALVAVLWGIGCVWYNRNKVLPLPVSSESVNTLSFGGLQFVEEESRFLTEKGEPMKLTPMQQQLMELFFRTPSHSLSKADICDALWPKKPDASDTLYTLIRRIKPIIEENSNLKIENDRGRDYTLKIK